MQHPYQCLAECGNILLAASNSRIDSFNLKDGSYISSWICPTTLTGSTDLATDIVGSQPSAPLPDCTSVSDSVSNTPLKRRRLLDTAERAKTIERVTEPPKNHRNQQPQQPTTGTVTCPPTIISLTFTKTGNHVIAVTGDDKSIRVLEHQKNGSLMQLSFRYSSLTSVLILCVLSSHRNMPKRPCAIALTADGSSIVCADKFGDVYSLPLLVPDVQSHSEEPVEVESSIIADAPKAFVSAANHLTIHTARNRRALLNQMKQTQNREKIEIASGQELLLGHVSMLTDLALAEFGGRNYIITADRDEHVRISRGIPQTHIIEGFCLGHNEFVSRLCLPKTHPNLLISGGGDNELYSWRWLSGELSNRVDLKRHLQVISEDLDVEIDDDNPTRLPASFEHPRIAVSNIRHTEAGQDGPGDFIIVTCEACVLIYPPMRWFADKIIAFHS